MIDKKAPPLNKLLKVGLLPASTEEVYFVPSGGHIDRNPGSDKNERVGVATATTTGTSKGILRALLKAFSILGRLRGVSLESLWYFGRASSP